MMMKQESLFHAMQLTKTQLSTIYHGIGLQNVNVISQAFMNESPNNVSYSLIYGIYITPRIKKVVRGEKKDI